MELKYSGKTFIEYSVFILLAEIKKVIKSVAKVIK